MACELRSLEPPRYSFTMATVASPNSAAPAVPESISESSQSYGKPASRNGLPDTIKIDGNKSLTLTPANLLLNGGFRSPSSTLCGALA